MLGKCLLSIAAFLLLYPVVSAPAEPPATQPADSQQSVRWAERPRLLIWVIPGALDESQKLGRTDDLQVLTRDKDAVAAYGFDLIAIPADGLITPGHPDDETRRLQMACRALPDHVIISTPPIGDEGWEANHDRARMERLVGKDAVEDIGRLTRRQHLAHLSRVEAAGYALNLSHLGLGSPAPKPEAVSFYADTFAAMCKEKNRRCFLWFSTKALADAGASAVISRVVEATKGRVEGYVWTEAPPLAVPNQPPLDATLAKVVEITPVDKTVMQYHHGKKLQTGTPKGVVEFTSACRQTKVDAFAVVAPWSQLNAKLWGDFYQVKTPPKANP